MEYEKKILKLFENGYLTTKSIVNNGIPRIYLTKLVKNGVIERVSRGILILRHFIYMAFLIEYPLSMILQLKMDIKAHYKKKTMLICSIQKKNY